MTEILRIWWDAKKARGNYGEFSQAVIRVGISFVLLSTYYAWMDWSEYPWVPYLFGSFVAYSVVVFAWTGRARESSDVIRFLTLIVDMGTATILLGLTGEQGVILIFVYSWVAVGYCFRFGLIGKDRARFQELTHALKGTAMMAGAIGLRNSAARAEIIADSDFDSVGAGTVEDLREALEETNHELSRMLA